MSARPRASSTASCAPREDVVVGDRDRAEAERARRGRGERGPASSSRASAPCACGGRRGRSAGRRADPERLGADAAACGARCGTRARAHRRAGRSPRAPPRLRASAELRVRQSSSSASRASAAPTSSGWPSEPGGSTRGTPAACGLEGRRALARAAAGTRPAAPISSCARVRASSPLRTTTRPRNRRGTYGRPVSGFVRRMTSSQPGRSARARNAARRRARSSGRHSSTMSLRGFAGANSSRSTPSGSTPVVAGEAGRGGLGGRLARRRQRVHPAEQPLALLLARRVAEPLGRVERGDRKPRACREARGRRGSGHPARGRGRRRSGRAVRASARLARTPIGTPRRLRRETGIDGPSATVPSSGVPSRLSRLRARRPAASSVARADGARTTTSCPLRRSSAVAPATWSFTGCGCDHANGVTMQILRFTAPILRSP